jgi:DNA-binding transcriptional LysR family regulator
MNQIYAMRVFVRVAETQSFRRAAQQLNVSNALVTRSIATLEAHLHARLINRTTRNLALTEAGAHYLEGCRGLLEELDHLDSAVACTEREPGGLLRIVGAGALAPQTLAPLVDGFRRRHPKIRVRLALAEHLARLPDNGYDVGIVTGFATANPELDLTETPLATQTLVACAASAYLAEHGEPHRATARAACRRRSRWRHARARPAGLHDRRSAPADIARLSTPPASECEDTRIRRFCARADGQRPLCRCSAAWCDTG